jgi:hypothetical protein
MVTVIVFLALSFESIAKNTVLQRQFDGNKTLIFENLNQSLFASIGELEVVSSLYAAVPRLDNQSFTNFLHLLAKDNVTCGLCELVARRDIPMLQQRLRAEVYAHTFFYL